jgi:NACHT domain-containing protein/restriction endonuclease
MIRLLESDSNRKGDLFGRLLQDYFHVLGYQDFRLNVHKSGREIDLQARHRTEPRLARAECKATADPIGGADMNKFVGALDAERRAEDAVPIEGYFVSLHGFKDSALEQERRAGDRRVVLVNGEDVERELVNGRIVVAREVAAACAGQCLASHDVDPGALRDGAELLGWEDGWVWCLSFGRGGDVEGFVLVHADGQALGSEAAARLIAADQAAAGHLHALRNLGPPAQERDAAVEQTRRAYLRHVAREYGDMTIDGLPADQEVGSQRITLEQLYVPLHLEPDAIGTAASWDEVGERQTDPERYPPERDGFAADYWVTGEDETERTDRLARAPVGQVLAQQRSIAVLGLPGAGKSTLLKRLAIAYADPERRAMVDDELPEGDWLPLVLRCRQLQSGSQGPIRALLEHAVALAELDDDPDVIARLVTSALKDGSALVLIDGLDEIPDDAARIAFVKQLRTFVGTYPTVRVVVTSREAGFRAVAGAMSDMWQRYRVSPFDFVDILQLTLAWHRLVVGQRESVERDATALARSIWDVRRVRPLAINPLLLTTLLLVRRWVGELPRKRTVLYDKAIEVLLMTWNVEGHEPIDLEEAVPRLAYLAYAMTVSGRHVLQLPEIRKLLTRARDDMPEILSYARTSPAAFVERVEERSSLLMLSGHAVVDGTLTPQYEFKHLTFQEYLTAVACVKGFHPDADASFSLAELLRPRFGDPNWREVVPLAAVLAGRDAGPVVEALCEVAESRYPSSRGPNNLLMATSLLAQTLADEAQLTPAVVDRAAHALTRSNAWTQRNPGLVPELVASRYGPRCVSVIEEQFHSGAPLRTASWILAETLVDQLLASGDDSDAVVQEIRTRLGEPEDKARAQGALLLAEVTHRRTTGDAWGDELSALPPATLMELAGPAVPALLSSHVPTHYAAVLAYGMLGESMPPLIPVPVAREIAPRLLELWYASMVDDVQSHAAWAFSYLPLRERNKVRLAIPITELREFIEREWSNGHLAGRTDRAAAAVMAAYLFGGTWREASLVRRARSTPHPAARRVVAWLHDREPEE